MSDEPNVVVEQTGDVGLLTFNRPHRRNALSDEMMIESTNAIRRFADDKDIRALVITGAGRGFCSGADLAVDGDVPLEDTAGSLGDSMRASINPLILAIVEAPFPVVAAVNGVAAGAGVGIALAADMLVASSSMQLLLTFSRIGMGLDAGTSWFLTRQLGMRRAAAVSMLVEPITAQLAVDWGLAWTAVPDDELMTEAMALATRLASGATLALASQKRQLLDATTMTLADALDAEADVQDRLVGTADLREALAAFRGSRKPDFSGE